MLENEKEILDKYLEIETKDNPDISLVIDSIIGIVKTRKQLDYCIQKNIYYTYKKLLIVAADKIKYIAIYQTINAFGYDEAGVFLYGEVSKIFNVKRSEIHYNVNENRKNEECVVFLVKEWLKLEHPISPLGNAKILVETNFGQLLKATTYNELML